ncbi:MAG: cytochrome c biogenesis protein CcmG/thiol:disulfide interchange protein DsbE [Candidatus Endobugula sp.]|jgi:cytochrome c biogenesis protein CcmG/thiol:disulfide interchange protein DsbE
MGWRLCITVLVLGVMGLAVAVMTVDFTRSNANFTAAVLPSFSLQDGMTGAKFTRRDLLGHKQLLNVWATWCVACREEHPFLDALSHDGVRIVGLFYRDAPASADKWLKERGNPYVANLLDMRGELADKLPVIGAPETYFISSSGVIVHKHSGILDKERWDDGLQVMYQNMQ